MQRGKKFKFDNMNKWDMHNQDAVLENDTLKRLWDFGIQMIHLISARRPDLILKEKLATVVGGDTKAPFSVATTPRCRGWRYSIPWIALLYPWSSP